MDERTRQTDGAIIMPSTTLWGGQGMKNKLPRIRVRKGKD